MKGFGLPSSTAASSPQLAALVSDVAATEVCQTSVHETFVSSSGSAAGLPPVISVAMATSYSCAKATSKVLFLEVKCLLNFQLFYHQRAAVYHLQFTLGFSESLSCIVWESLEQLTPVILP